MNDREYIKKCDGNFRARLYDVADALSARLENDKDVGLVCLAGPTCSGKTTAAAMLASRMEESGRQVHIISIDDFYYDREYLHELSIQKGIDGIDYDSEDTINLEALGNFVREALSGTEAHCPTFDFATGNRNGYRTVSSGEGDVFIFEGIQALYPRVLSMLKPYGLMSVYIAPLTPLCQGDNVFMPDEIRFLRRIVRDANFRSTTADFTMHLWENVRLNEEKNIFPFVDKCMYRIDSTHEYELGVLKPYLDKILNCVPRESKNFSEAQRILAKINYINPIDSELVGDESLYKEFV